MKKYIDDLEYYPFLIIRDLDEYDECCVEINEELYEEYKVIMKKFKELQYKLACFRDDNEVEI